MPDTSGDEVLAEIDTRGLDCRDVMLTAVDPAFDIVDMAFDAYVVKPVERADVTGVVAEMLERATYDDDFEQFRSLASKQAALEPEKNTAELESSEAYHPIEEWLATMRDDLGIETDDIEGIFGGTVPDIATSDASPQSAEE